MDLRTAVLDDRNKRELKRGKFNRRARRASDHPVGVFALQLGRICLSLRACDLLAISLATARRGRGRGLHHRLGADRRAAWVFVV